ncbi:hypothetical protein HMPREF0765_3869 [Sphingobacterium spiritivorum ATCC 33300]|uniref:DUF4269 domain-containing protein n=1 Tax=Sphingobacterium spiritivorum ATCC 33300 TaxID=525372 RepID=C2G2R3_SPHSI|nr:hypothetical protein HMPREF0765_3869 [Sphingobacterium spiritivorum ATCC 33300]
MQQEIYQLLQKHRIFDLLAVYHPILAGTYPIAINIDSSDLDIICEVQDFESFQELLKKEFANREDFCVRHKIIYDEPSVICSFKLDRFEFELFGQNIPTTRQYAYRHMLIEYNLLKTHGDLFREKIIQLKKQGIKTEPAFAQLLGLEGDPYLALLDIEKL